MQPFSVGHGLYIHHKTRSKTKTNILSDLNLSTPYERV